MKSELHALCIELAEGKFNALQNELNSMCDAVQTESKSTAGDKHETGRAMIHLEQEKLQKQLAEAKAVVVELEQIKPEQTFESVQKGALVETDKATFYIAVGIGKQTVEGSDVFVISSQSPIAKQMLGKRSGESFDMNGMEYGITAVQ